MDTYGHLVMDATMREAVDRALAGFSARRGPIPGAAPGIPRLTAVVERSA